MNINSKWKYWIINLNVNELCVKLSRFNYQNLKLNRHKRNIFFKHELFYFKKFASLIL